MYPQDAGRNATRLSINNKLGPGQAAADGSTAIPRTDTGIRSWTTSLQLFGLLNALPRIVLTN